MNKKTKINTILEEINKKLLTTGYPQLGFTFTNGLKEKGIFSEKNILTPGEEIN